MQRVSESFRDAGWAVEETPGGEIVGRAGRLVVAPDEKLLGDETVFELLDEELSMKVYARQVPTPQRAAELIDEYGAPAEVADATPGKVPVIPPQAEVDR